MWFISTSLQWNLGPRPHAAQGSEAWWPAAQFKKVLPSCANSTVQPVFSVTQAGRAGAVAAVTAKGILQPEIPLLVTPFRTGDHPGHQGCSARWLAHRSPGDTVDEAHFRTAPFRTSSSQNATSSCSPIFVELQQWTSRAAQSLAEPRLGQEALREPSVATSPAPCYVDITAPSCWLRCQKALTGTRSRNFGFSFGKRVRLVSLMEEYWGSSNAATN